MPRASVSVRTVRSRRRGKKWSPVLVELHPDPQQISPSSNIFFATTICENSNNTNVAPTATVIKVGNLKVSFECESSSNRAILASGSAYIMFVPQGLTPTTDYPMQHPEYIMVWRSFNPAGAVSAVTMQSRLKRNLNSGDKIILFYKVRNDDTGANLTIAFRGIATYVCCAN